MNRQLKKIQSFVIKLNNNFKFKGDDSLWDVLRKFINKEQLM